MNFLGIDTASRLSSVFVGDEQRIRGESIFLREQASRLLSRTVEDALSASEMSLQEVDAILVNSGPGSLTGIKIGIAFATTLGNVLHKPVIGISALEAFAFSLNARFYDHQREIDAGPDTHFLLPVIQAVRGEIFYGWFQPSHPLPVKISDWSRTTPDALLTQCKGKRVWLGGDALPLFPIESLKRKQKEIFPVADLYLPSPIGYLQWASYKMRRKKGKLPPVEPIYLYPPPISSHPSPPQADEV